MHSNGEGGAYEKTIGEHGVKNPTGRESASGVRHRRPRRALVGYAMVRCVRRSGSLKPIRRAPYHKAQFRVSYHASSGFIIHRTSHERVEALAVLPTPARCSLSSAPVEEISTLGDSVRGLDPQTRIWGQVEMARPLRIEFPGAVYHVTSRGNARQDIVADDRDRTQ